MPDHPIPPNAPQSAAYAAPRDAKAERLAEALRANLKRRKAADRVRRARTPQDGDIEGSVGEEPGSEDDAVPGDD